MTALFQTVAGHLRDADRPAEQLDRNTPGEKLPENAEEHHDKSVKHFERNPQALPESVRPRLACNLRLNSDSADLDNLSRFGLLAQSLRHENDGTRLVRPDDSQRQGFAAALGHDFLHL